jgi:hypothetical protein
MSLQDLESILNDFKKQGLNFLEVKADYKVQYVLKDFIYTLTGFTNEYNNFDLLYIDNGKLNIIEDGRYKYIIMREKDQYKVWSNDILELPTQKLLR